MSFPPIDQDVKLWVLLHQTRDAAYKVTEKELRPLGLSPMEAGVLFVVNATGERATPAEISRWLFRESHSVSGLLDRMEQKGLVKRNKDLEKRNLVRISLTDKAREIADSYLGTKTLHRILAALTEEQRQQLGQSLQILRDTALADLGFERALPFPGPL
jgi:DNA-binding MarR family transcriptional regulator